MRPLGRHFHNFHHCKKVGLKAEGSLGYLLNRTLKGAVSNTPRLSRFINPAVYGGGYCKATTL